MQPGKLFSPTSCVGVPQASLYGGLSIFCLVQEGVELFILVVCVCVDAYVRACVRAYVGGDKTDAQSVSSEPAVT